MKFFKITFFLLMLIVVSSCSKDDDANPDTPSGTYLTINGDTREIVHNGDSDLRITKEIVTNSPRFNNISGSHKVINLDIYDPNRSLIANFGDYNYGYYLILRFVLPTNFTAGTYTTIGWSNNSSTLGQNQSFSEFLALTEFVKNIKGGQTYEIKEDGNKWIVEFNNLEYEGDNNTATISGRIVLNK